MIPSFWASLAGAFVYPLKGDGLVTLIAGLVFFTAAHYVTFILAFFPLLGWLIAVVFYVVLTGYFAGYLMEIMERSARGDQDAPPWPDLTDYQETALKPFLFVLALGVICLGPSFAYEHLSAEPSRALGVAILMAGMFYMPMGMLCVALVNDVSGLNPVAVVRAIMSVPGRYIVAWALVVFSVAAYGLGGQLIATYLPIPILGYVAQRAVVFYFLFAAARVMGLLYRTAGERLDWLAG